MGIYFRSSQHFKRETVSFCAFSASVLECILNTGSDQLSENKKDRQRPGPALIGRAVHMWVRDFTLSLFGMVSIEMEPTNSGDVR